MCQMCFCELQFLVFVSPQLYSANKAKPLLLVTEGCFQGKFVCTVNYMFEQPVMINKYFLTPRMRAACS